MSTTNTPGYDAASLAPPAHWHDHHGHVVQFYSEDAFLIDELSRFVGATLGAGDAAIVIGTKAHRDGLAQLLNARGVDLFSAINQGRYVSVDAADTLSKFTLDGWPDAERFAEIMGSVIARAAAAAQGEQHQVAAFGEMVALLWAQGKPEAAIRLEQLWNDLARKHSFSLRCAYPISGFSQEEHSEPFLRICAEHSSVIPGESYTALVSEQERLRSITFLQQKAQMLEAEKAERKKIQKSLQRRESDLAEILENAVEGVQQVGPDQRVLWANKALLNLLGYAADEYVNHHLAEFHVDREIFNEFWQKLMAGQDIYDFSAELRCKDGSVKNVLIHSNGLWEDGQFVHTRCFVRDVTEQTRMAQALRENQEALRKSHEELEERVEQRTRQLQELMSKLHAEVEQRTEAEIRLRELSGRLLSLRDEERRKLARELHDSTGQLFTALQLNLALLQQGASEMEVSRRISNSIDLAGQAINEIRTMAYLLHPPMLDEAGLLFAIQWYVDGFVKRTNIQVDLDLPQELDRLPQELETTVFRIVQEALTNVHRHSGSSTAKVQLTLGSDQIHLLIQDQGTGISLDKLESEKNGASKMGVGIRGMRERVRQFGGMLNIGDSTLGTRVEAILPLCFPP